MFLGLYWFCSDEAHMSHSLYSSKLLVSTLISPIAVPYILTFITPLKDLRPWPEPKILNPRPFILSFFFLNHITAYMYIIGRLELRTWVCYQAEGVVMKWCKRDGPPERSVLLTEA